MKLGRLTPTHDHTSYAAKIEWAERRRMIRDATAHARMRGYPVRQFVRDTLNEHNATLLELASIPA